MAKITGRKVDPKLELAFNVIMKERTDKEERLHQLIERYNIEVERAIKHGEPVPLSIE